MRDMRPEVASSAHFTAIWREEWARAQPGKHEIRDGCGRRWEVIENLGFSDEKTMCWLKLRNREICGDWVMTFIYVVDSLRRHVILSVSGKNSQYVLDHHFNHPNALVIDLEQEQRATEERPDELFGRPFIGEEILSVDPGEGVTWGCPPIQRSCFLCYHYGGGVDKECSLSDAREWFGIVDGTSLPRTVEVDDTVVDVGNYCPFFDSEDGE